MNFRNIINIVKGDFKGHDFHGNQWVTEGGSFVAKPPRNRKPAQPAEPKPVQPKPDKPQRQPRQRVAPKPETPQPPKPSVKPLQSVKNFKNFLGLKTNKIIKNIGEKLKMGGAQQKFMGKVEMSDGSFGVTKQFGQWKGHSAQSQAEAEVLASRFAQACDLPYRTAEYPEGDKAKDTVVQTWVEGKTVRYLDGDPPRDTSPRGVPEKFREQYGEIAVADAITGNHDSHGDNVMIANISDDVKSMSEAAKVPEAQAVGIDHGLCFIQSNYTDTIVRTADKWGMPPERLTEIATKFQAMTTDGSLTPSEVSRIQPYVDNAVSAARAYARMKQ